MVMVNMDDVMRCGHCAKGTRRWFEGYGLDFRKFLKEGIPEADFLATGDGLAHAIVAAKNLRQADGQE